MSMIGKMLWQCQNTNRFPVASEISCLFLAAALAAVAAGYLAAPTPAAAAWAVRYRGF